MYITTLHPENPNNVSFSPDQATIECFAFLSRRLHKSLVTLEISKGFRLCCYSQNTF